MGPRFLTFVFSGNKYIDIDGIVFLYKNILNIFLSYLIYRDVGYTLLEILLSDFYPLVKYFFPGLYCSNCLVSN